MIIRTGAALGNGRSITVELNDQDGQESFPDWSDLTTNQKFRKLSAKADALVVYYLHREKAISEQTRDSRLREIQGHMA